MSSSGTSKQEVLAEDIILGLGSRRDVRHAFYCLVSTEPRKKFGARCRANGLTSSPIPFERRGGAVFDAEFFEDGGDVFFYGGGFHVEDDSDFFVGFLLAQPGADELFAIVQQAFLIMCPSRRTHIARFRLRSSRRTERNRALESAVADRRDRQAMRLRQPPLHRGLDMDTASAAK